MIWIFSVFSCVHPLRHHWIFLHLLFFAFDFQKILTWFCSRKNFIYTEQNGVFICDPLCCVWNCFSVLPCEHNTHRRHNWQGWSLLLTAVEICAAHIWFGFTQAVKSDPHGSFCANGFLSKAKTNRLFHESGGSELPGCSFLLTGHKMTSRKKPCGLAACCIQVTAFSLLKSSSVVLQMQQKHRTVAKKRKQTDFLL